MASIKTPAECERFERNAIERGREDLAREARRKAVDLRAEAYGAKTTAEREALQAVYAYEEVLSRKKGRRTRASRTWQMIERHGILPAVERAVNRPHETAAYVSLLEVGLEEYAFEAVVLRHPEHFTEDCVDRCKQRAASWESA